MLADSGRAFLQRALGPLARRLPPWVSPNLLTGCALGVSVLAGIALYLTDRSPLFFLVAAAFGVLYGILDALDGMIARRRESASAWGDFLDHSFDRLSALLAFGGLALTSHCNHVLGLLLMIGMLFHGFLGTQMEASFGVRIYRGIGIAEAIAVAVVYCLTGFVVRASGLPFFFREPFTGRMLSITDIFITCAFPLVLFGTLQRFLIARDLARGPGRKRASTLGPSDAAAGAADATRRSTGSARGDGSD